jgi:outer membrane protein assembly factor BamD (BamD/ComL family)
MKCSIKILIVAALTIVISTACSPNSQEISEPTVKQIKSFYHEGIDNINRLEILSADGEQRSSKNIETIENWLEQVGELNVTIDLNPQEHNGNLFVVTLYENTDNQFQLSSTSIDGTAIIANQELVNYIHQLWEKFEQ